MRSASLRPAPLLVLGAIAGLSATTLALTIANGTSLSAFVDGNEANGWISALAFGVVAALVLWRQPGNRIGPLLAGAALLVAISVAAYPYAYYGLHTRPGSLPLTDLAAWCAGVLWMTGLLVIIGSLTLLFPNGRLASPGWRWPTRAVVAASVIATLAAGTTQVLVDDSMGVAVVGSPFDLPFPDGPQMVVAAACIAVVFAVAFSAAVGIALRMRRVTGPERRQYAWFIVSILLLVIPMAVPIEPPDVVGLGVTVLAIAALGVGIVRYGLFDIEVVLSRTLVYLVLTGGALAVYSVAAVAVGAQLDAGLFPAAAAAAAVLLLAAIRERVQRAVNRLLYGDRRDPLSALTTLGNRLGAALDSDAVLPAVAETVRQTLRLPYAAVRLANDEQPACTSGEPPARTVEFNLVHAGQQVGTLIVGVRRGELGLGAADTRLLETFAAQIGVAAHDVRVTRELRQSREALVTSREEERRRIRQDLHDGLGPTLAGISLGLETAARRARRADPEVGTLLESLSAETTAAVSEIRRIVADLHPTILDMIGLVPALVHHAGLISSRTRGDLVVNVVAEPLPELPTAVEAAAYRITLEALTNVVRHSRAAACDVRLTMGRGVDSGVDNGFDGGVHRGLRLTIRDDGIGAAPIGPVRGAGLASMQARAEELGGACTVRFRRDHGTEIVAMLPVTAP